MPAGALSVLRFSVDGHGPAKEEEETKVRAERLGTGFLAAKDGREAGRHAAGGEARDGTTGGEARDDTTGGEARDDTTTKVRAERLETGFLAASSVQAGKLVDKWGGESLAGQ